MIMRTEITRGNFDHRKKQDRFESGWVGHYRQAVRGRLSAVPGPGCECWGEEWFIFKNGNLYTIAKKQP